MLKENLMTQHYHRLLKSRLYANGMTT